MELLAHSGEHHEIGDGGWLMMTTATNPPLRSPEEIRAWRWLRIIKRDETSSLIFSPRNAVGGESGGPRDRGARPEGGCAPTLVDKVWAPWP